MEFLKGIFVNDSGIRYAAAIVGGYKTIETRSRNMLSALVGSRVAIIQTGRGAPVVIGYATITASAFCPSDRFSDYFGQHLVPPGSRYDSNGRGKWFYYLSDAETCTPYPLPADAVRHGRSWCEFAA